ncbi:MAG: ATP phosphoribosyltransferase [Balneola sp.]|jgi:ATP phosphoribosyltransferase|nr:ATP phosphoribosyltransferase [Balneola sp.]MBE78479.1 ATP phosphoribosyltransferase [Balneola sp.]HBX66129.1 ATP phosphoribosyltransferase [Balneolaceae bacterium]|tara:strand:- start:87 stop:968 length:882 start_codon:yes stop_codon:yes gene_type:complete
MNRTKDSSTSLRIAIQKSGRLTDKTIDLLEGIGIEFDNYKRNLIVKTRNFDVELLLLRDDDIPEYVQDGVCDLGFVGANETQENGADVTPIRDLQYGKCRLSLAAPKDGDIREPKDFEGKKVATSYPNLTKKFFSEKGIDIKVVEISGAVEIAPQLEVADAIVDLVSSGGTLRANGLVELDTILESQTQLIRTNKELSPGKQHLIEKFLVRMDGYQQAAKSRYIMLNAATKDVDTIKKIIPSLKSPTVMPLAETDMVAIHTVIPLDKFWIVMEELKEAGASDIVMLPIESMIL